MAKRRNKKRRRHPEAAPIGWLTPEKLRDIWTTSERVRDAIGQRIEDGTVTPEEAQDGLMPYFRSHPDPSAPGGKRTEPMTSWEQLWAWYVEDRRDAEIQLHQQLKTWTKAENKYAETLERKADDAEADAERLRGERQRLQGALLILHELGRFPEYERIAYGDGDGDFHRVKPSDLVSEPEGIEAMGRLVRQGLMSADRMPITNDSDVKVTREGELQVGLRIVYQWLLDQRKTHEGKVLSRDEVPDHIQNVIDNDLLPAGYVDLLPDGRMQPTERARATMVGPFWNYFQRTVEAEAPLWETARIGWNTAARATSSALSGADAPDPLALENPPGEATLFAPAQHGLLWLPTITVARFSAIAREEGLPMALTEEELARMPRHARHICQGARTARTDDGRHYVLAEMMLVVERTDLDDMTPDDRLDTLLDPPTSPDARRYQETLLNEGVLAAGEGDRLVWAELNVREQMLEQVRAGRDWTRPELRTVGFPLQQFGLLVDATKPRNEAWGETGEEMPVHAGSHSFETIWKRLSHRATRTKAAVDRFNDIAGARDVREIEEGEVMDIIEEPGFARGIQAHGVLALMRRARVVTVGIDVAEGLPDWESMAECWHYAQTANLPFDVIYLDFTTPGGFTPQLQIQTRARDGGESKPVDVSLSGALVTSSGITTVVPFAWLPRQDQRPWTATPAGQNHTDYDPTAIVYFGGEKQPDPIRHLRIPAPRVSGPLVSMRNDALMRHDGRPEPIPIKEWGWTEIADDLKFHGDSDPDELIKAHGMVAIAAAARSLSVLHALESTVNIDLAEDVPPRPVRREVKRLREKGQRAEIALTVQIRATRHRDKDDDREPRKRHYSHAHWRRGTYAHYPLGTRIADALAEEAPDKLVDHPTKGLCRRVYRSPTIVGRYDEDGTERAPVAKSYVWKRRD